MTKQMKFQLNKKIISLILILQLFSCVNHDKKEGDGIYLSNFNYEISHHTPGYSSQIYNENKMEAKIGYYENNEYLIVKVCISDDHEKRIIGSLRQNIDTIELSYIHNKRRSIIEILLGPRFTVQIYELNYFICGLKKGKDYYIKFKNPEYTMIPSLKITTKSQILCN